MLDGANEIILVILNIPEDLKKIARFARILVDYNKMSQVEIAFDFVLKYSNFEIRIEFEFMRDFLHF